MMKTLTIVAFGDSITMSIQVEDERLRWTNLLRRRLREAFPDRESEVFNAGVGGNSTREAMARLEKDVLAHRPDWVLLEFGGNNDDPFHPERRVSVPEYRRYLEEFRTRIPPETGVIVITFPPIIDEQHVYCGSEWCRRFGGIDAAAERFRIVSRGFAAENGFPLVDLAATLKVQLAAGDPNLYILPDGVHLNEAGNRLLAELVFSTLEPRLRN